MPVEADQGPRRLAMSGDELSRDPDGDVALDWRTADGSMLSISIAPDGRAAYAWSLADGRKGHGTAMFDPGASAVLSAALATRQPALAGGAWIPVSSGRLPDFDTPVWLADAKNVWVGGRCDDSDGWLWGNCYGSQYIVDGKWKAIDFELDDDYQPTYWQALPAPPEAAPGGDHA